MSDLEKIFADILALKPTEKLQIIDKILVQVQELELLNALNHLFFIKDIRPLVATKKDIAMMKIP